MADDPPPNRGPTGPPPWVLPASVYLGLGFAGVALFLVAVVTPILSHVPEASLLRVVLAAIGGFVAVVGIGRWSVLRQFTRRGRRPTEVEMKKSMPSIEFFSPPRPGEEPPKRRTAARADAVGVLAMSAAVAIVLLMLVSAIPAGVGAGPAAIAPSPALRPLAGPPVPKCNPPFYPQYGAVDGLWPILPRYTDQSPCTVTHDEVHATFSSSVAGSAEEVQVPIHLPGNATVNPDTQYTDAYLGMVVQGDAQSVGGQSYAELVMAPGWNGTGLEWNVSVAIWSVLLNTTCPTGMNFTWIGEYACEVDDAFPGGDSSLGTGLPGDQWANVTFIGSATSSAGTLTIAFNDSSNASLSASFTASAKDTGTYAFRPYYVAACPDLCDLNWSQQFGLGFGVDLCDFNDCYSYNATAASLALPFEVLSPEFWNGLAFASDYQYIAYESSTGACGGVATVAPCDPYAQIGQYPFFTFNGTSLDFGGNYSWTTETFGGAPHEFSAYATATDFVPLFLDELTNSSRAGYVTQGSPFWVTVRVQDLGSVRWANLSYVLPNGGGSNTTMSVVAGGPADGIYNGSVPTSGLNGTIQFRVTVTNDAGLTVTLPPSGDPASSVQQSPVPTVTALLDQSPAGCGGISIAGGPVQPNGTSVGLEAGFYAIRSQGCYPNQFVGWRTTGGLSIPVGAGPATTIELHANGTVTALWRYVVPHDQILLAFSPAGCGQILLNGSSILAPGRSVTLRNGGTYPISEVGCAGEAFEGWSVTSATSLAILGANLTVEGNGTITAQFVAAASSVPLTLQTVPGGCGGVRIGGTANGAGYVNGTILDLVGGATYPVGPVPCAGWGFAGNVTVTGGALYTAGTIVVSSAASITYSYYRLTLVTVVTAPSGCGGVEFDGVFEPGGSVLNVTNHTVHTVLAEPCAGYYTQAFVALGNLSLAGTVLTVNGYGTLQLSFRAGQEQFWVGFISNPIACGSIVFDGTAYTNSEYDYVLPDTAHTLTVDACPGYGFVAWTINGAGVALRDPATDPDNLIYVNSSGSIEAIFHPLVAVEIETNPATCGGVDLNGIAYGNGASPLFPEFDSFPISALPCAHDRLEGWQTSGGASVTGSNVTINATSIVLAMFLPELYPIHIAVAPSSCGPVVLQGLDELNNSTVPLPAGAYAIAPPSCAGFELLGYTTDAGLTVTGGTLDVNGAGNITVQMGPIPPSLSFAVPTSSAVGSAITFSVAVAQPVPPYNYTYVWRFGDGATLTTPSNFTEHAYAGTGTYEVTVTVTDPYGQSATADGNVTVVTSPPTAAVGLGPLGVVVIVGAIAAVGVAVAVALIRSRRPRTEGMP